jgi:hypothetical protein
MIYDPEQVDRESNVRKFCTNGLFVSHSGLDYQIILERLIRPSKIRALFEPDGIFIHSSKSGGAIGYVELVFAALNCCDKFLVCASANSAVNSFVYDEIDWILRTRSSIIVCSLDGTEPSALHLGLAESNWNRRQGKLYVLRADRDLTQTQTELSKIIRTMLVNSPFEFPPA